MICIVPWSKKCFEAPKARHKNSKSFTLENVLKNKLPTYLEVLFWISVKSMSSRKHRIATTVQIATCPNIGRENLIQEDHRKVWFFSYLLGTWFDPPNSAVVFVEVNCWDVVGKL